MSVAASGASAQGIDPADFDRSIGLFVGNMTSNRAEDLLVPGALDYIDQYFVGVALAYEQRIGQSRFFWGGEVQLNQHFGEQEYLEAVIPATLRFRPEWDSFRSFGGVAFGLGLSHSFDEPEIEIETKGGSSRTLVYWFMEASFSLGDRKDEIFARFHHRSDAFGVFQPDTGSNAVAVGYRQNF